MIKRRMISSGISTSEQVNSLPIECQLLFTWMIPHADDDGRMKGSALSVRGNVFPMKDFTDKQIEEMLEKIKDVGLIWRWSVGNDTYIEFPKWLSHQKIRGDRYHKSTLPPYKEHVNQDDTNGIPTDNQTYTKDNIVEENKVEESIVQKNVMEWESEGELSSFPTSPQLHGFSENAAYRAWKLLDHDKPELLESRYLNLARLGAPTGKIIMLSQEISRDNSITDKGFEFEKQISLLLTTKNKTINSKQK